jgi:hypothetical protein
LGPWPGSPKPKEKSRAVTALLSCSAERLDEPPWRVKAAKGYHDQTGVFVVPSSMTTLAQACDLTWPSR